MQLPFRSKAVKAASGVAPSKEIITDELQGIVRFTFHAGMVDEFKRLSGRNSPAARFGLFALYQSL